MVTTVQAAVQGLGVYSVAEAARYARMPAATLSRWFFGTKIAEPMSRSAIADDGAKRISFTDFVEALAIRSLRADHGVSLPKIKEAIRNACDQYGIEHPFARKEPDGAHRQGSPHLSEGGFRKSSRTHGQGFRSDIHESMHRNLHEAGKNSAQEKLPMICREWGITHVVFTPGIIGKGFVTRKNAIAGVWEQLFHLHRLPPGTQVKLGESKKKGDVAGFELRISQRSLASLLRDLSADG